MGNQWFRRGRYEQAMGYYTRAIELAGEGEVGKKVAGYNNRAACHTQTHNYPQVIADTSAVLELDPGNVKATLRRAYAYKGLERWKAAMADFTAVNAVQPSANVSQEIRRCKQYLG